MNRNMKTAKRFAVAAAAVLVASGAPASVFVAFPAEGAVLPAVSKCHIIGAVEPGAADLTINGAPVAVYRTGAFVAMLNLVPGATNSVRVASGGTTLERRFFVPAPAKPGSAPPPPPPVKDPDSDPRVLKPWSAWAAKGNVFENRVRKEPGEGDTIAYLPAGFAVQGAELQGRGYVAVWLGGEFGFIAKTRLVKRIGPPPPRDLPAPDLAAGFAERPSGGKPSAIKILVDPGHGGTDNGTVSPHGLKEKDANLLQAIAVAKALSDAGFDVRMTRTDDSFPSLYDRPLAALEWKADAFVSIHHNATPAQSDPRKARHTVAYASNDRGYALAEAIQKRVAAELPDVPDKGAQYASFAVCRNPAVPSCLLEIDFINLPTGEEAVFFDKARRKRVAEAIVRGIKDWAGLQ